MASDKKLRIQKALDGSLNYNVSNAEIAVVGAAGWPMKVESLPMDKALWGYKRFRSKAEAQEYIDAFKLTDIETPQTIKSYFGGPLAPMYQRQH